MKRKHKYNWTVVWDFGAEVYYRHFRTELGAYRFLVNLISKEPGIYEPDGYIVLKRKEFEEEKKEMDDINHYERG